MVVLSTCCKKAAAFRAVILGAPASGKGTVSSRIIKNFNVAHISSGDKLRLNVAAGTGLGKEVKQFLDSGSLVPDDVMISLISKEIESVGNQNWLLDGFPRTLEQAEKLQKVHPGKDDITGEPLSQRLDDRPEVVKKRLDDYARMTDPVINYYRKNGILHDFSGNTTDAMWPHIKECVGQLIKT
ncbi:GTP:AMP phosphotransferase AK3, mitochondrial isoform X2 [Belonocnema kinseyi]|uniref:GTP:AMP phosphotransferase AK3, mitochondrial isoform X2 n=1 Tax=Belonocnema kinseyi TaxID=2817044 RepID=UPI00143CE644|nr:GTP:AMP phosphotransferase AK3, mitochondrial isoform X2 [Belonocnema kinseyi]